jgi:hypothetical protein
VGATGTAGRGRPTAELFGETRSGTARPGPARPGNTGAGPAGIRGCKCAAEATRRSQRRAGACTGPQGLTADPVGTAVLRSCRCVTHLHEQVTGPEEQRGGAVTRMSKQPSVFDPHCRTLSIIPTGTDQNQRQAILIVQFSGLGLGIFLDPVGPSLHYKN